MDKEITKAIAQLTAIYITLLVILIWFLHFQVIFIPIPFKGDKFYLDPSFLFLPLLSLSSIQFASKIINKILTGKFEDILTSKLKSISYVFFIWLLTFDKKILMYVGPLGFFLLRPVSFLILIVALIDFTYSIINNILQKNNQPIAEIISTSLYILGSGITTGQVWLNINQVLHEYEIFAPNLSYYYSAPNARVFISLIGDISAVLNKILLFSASITSVFKLFGIFRYHQNPYISYLSGYSSNLIKKFLLSFILFTYILFLRGYLTMFVEDNSYIIIIFEWVVVCLISYVMYNKMKHYISDSLLSSDVFGRWEIHLQEIAQKTNVKFDNLLALIEKFIQNGEKDVLLVFLVDYLRRYNLPIFTVSSLLTDLINYRDQGLGTITFRWQNIMQNEQNLEKRREVLHRVLENIRARTNLSSIRSGMKDRVELNGEVVGKQGSEIMEAEKYET